MSKKRSRPEEIIGKLRKVVMNLTGHRTLSRFTRYNTVDPAEGKEAARRLMSYLSKKG